jgi:hypothetical protein
MEIAYLPAYIYGLLTCWLLKENMVHQKYIDRMLNSLTYNAVTYCWESSYSLNPCGYAQIKIDHKVKTAHRVMYQYIYGNIPLDKPCILHRCDNPKCCNPMHLYAGTMQNNSIDRENRHRSNHPYGEKHWATKLTEAQVIEIRASNETQIVLAQRFKVSQPIIHYVKTYRTWKHI